MVVCEHLKVSLTVNKEIRIAVINIFVSSRDSQVKSCYNFHDFFFAKRNYANFKKRKIIEPQRECDLPLSRGYLSFHILFVAKFTRILEEEGWELHPSVKQRKACLNKHYKTPQVQWGRQTTYPLFQGATFQKKTTELLSLVVKNFSRKNITTLIPSHNIAQRSRQHNRDKQ